MDRASASGVKDILASGLCRDPRTLRRIDFRSGDRDLGHPLDRAAPTASHAQAAAGARGQVDHRELLDQLDTYNKPPRDQLPTYLAEFAFRREFRDPAASFETRLLVRMTAQPSTQRRITYASDLPRVTARNRIASLV